MFSITTGICEVTVRTISIIVHLSNVLQIFLLLSVLVVIIILHVSYELFRWFYNIFRLKVCAVNCQCATEWRYYIPNVRALPLNRMMY